MSTVLIQSCALWILRLLDHVSNRPALSARVRRIDAACGLAGIPAWNTDDGARTAVISARLATMQRARRHRRPPLPGLAALADSVGLDEVERGLLEVAVAAAAIPGLDELFNELEPLLPGERHQLLGVVLGVSHDAVRRALAPDAMLRRFGLLTTTVRSIRGCTWLEPLPRLVEVAFDDADHSPVLERLFPALPGATLTKDHFPHLAADVDRLRRVIGGALRERTVGFDVLLHGPPGTGKSQLARLLAGAAASTALEVPIEDEDHDSLRHGSRLQAWALCQRVAAGVSGALVVFDEAEDAFPDANPFRGDRGTSKGWFSRQLECHPVPTIWVANQVAHLDPAFMRRFDVVLEVGPPPRVVRRQVLEDRLAMVPLSGVRRDELADDKRITAAHLDRAARAVALLGATSEVEASEALDAFLQPQLAFIAPRPRVTRDTTFDPLVPRASHDLERLAAGVARTGRAALLLHGAPGTGKTGWARHLAVRCERPLHARGASDLLGPYVGETERNLADAFARATAEGAVLLLDEVDSLLRTRARAQHSWEVSLVNELLVQLDRFEGIVLCATNRADDLDPAALRRFAAQVHFQPPDQSGRRRLLALALDALALPPPDEVALSRIDALDGLTPGAVEAARRQLVLLGEPTSRDLLDRLEAAHQPVRRLGFGS